MVRFERAIVQGSLLVGLSTGGLFLWAAANEGSADLAALAVISAAIGIASVVELLVARYFPVTHMVVFALAAALFPLDMGSHLSLGLGSALIACAAFGIILIEDLYRRWAFLTLIGVAGATHLLRWVLSGATTHAQVAILISQGAIFIAVTYAFDRFRTEMLLWSEVDRMKDEFLASVSHELRTPLTGVVGFAELGRGEASSPGSEREARGYFDEILAEGYRMSHIVDSLIAAAGGESLRSESDLSHVHLRPLVEATLRHLGLDAGLMGASDGAGCAHADPQLVVVVLQHLVRNAVDHGGGELALSMGRRGNNVVVRVFDGGAVIPRKHRDAIFLPYTTVGAPREPRRLGLGLVIARRLARSMGGDVTYDFKDDDGPSFNLELVALTCHADPHAPQVAEQKQSGWLNGGNREGSSSKWRLPAPGPIAADSRSWATS
jgi:signal transduction histidine kinase